MRRRTAIAVLASAGTSILSGCSFERERLHQEPATAEKYTETTTRVTEESPAADRRPGDVPTNRVFDGQVVSENSLGVTANRWFGLDEVRYEADGADDRKTVTTDRGWFVAYEFEIENLGESAVEPLPDSQFELGIDGETYEHIHEFPGGVQFDMLDQPSSEPQIRPLAWYGSLEPGEAVSLQLVYEAPVRTDYRQYLVWAHETSVEGGDEPVYLTGRRETVDRN